MVFNGEIPDSSFFKRDIPIIAVDGGANRLLSIGVQPDLVMGDFINCLLLYSFLIEHFFFN